jgi:hypothetical protein
MSLFNDASLILTPNGYKEGKIYSLKPFNGSGDLTVVRNTTATRVNSNGLIETVGLNVPRIDYSNGSCPSILVEPQRTNFALRSEEFNDASWGKTNVTVTANTTTAPDGTLTADKFIATSAFVTHQIAQITALNAYTFSVYAKAGEENVFSMWVANATKRAQFNLTLGTIEISTVLSSSIEDVGNGWYRCTVYDTTPSLAYRIYGRNGGSYLGNDVDGFFLWGAQLEAGAYATSYIPTTSASVTRNGDVISKTGISSLIGQSEGTIFFEGNVLNYSQARRFIVLYQDANNYIMLRVTGGNDLQFLIVSGGATSVNIITANIQGNIKIALAYNNNDFVAYLNGTQVGSDTSGSVPTTSDFYLGCDQSGINQIAGGIKSAAIWKTRLSNAELENLTTI